MAELYWQTVGEGKQDIVLLHGWGLNAEVWRSIALRGAGQYRFHLVDLPGYGRSQEFPAMSLQHMSDQIWQHATQILTQPAIWLGWSLGGLVASRIAIDHAAQITGLVTVASSPCFHQQDDDWPGIKPEILSGFEQQLAHHFQRTVERFLALQTLGTASAREDARLLKSIVLELPIPKVEILNAGLEILRTVDLRQSLKEISIPFLRIYGYLDGLVPRRVVPLIDDLYPSSSSVIMRNCAHAPFISHPEEFLALLADFTASIDDQKQCELRPK